MQNVLERLNWFQPYKRVLNSCGSWLQLFIFTYFFFFSFYVVFNSQGHIVMGSLRVEEPVHTSWSIFYTVNHWASASNYQLSNMKWPSRDSNWRPKGFKASTLAATPPSPSLTPVPSTATLSNKYVTSPSVMLQFGHQAGQFKNHEFPTVCWILKF